MIAMLRVSSLRRYTRLLCLFTRGIPLKTAAFFFSFLLLCSIQTTVFANPVTAGEVITGKITGGAGEPVAGATISEKGTKNSVITKNDGSFSIEVSGKLAVLVVSHVGFVTKEVALNGQSSVSVELETTNTSLGEVVVIGYGTTKRKDLTGAVASISGKQIAAVPVANAAQALQGKLPGVNVVTQDGRPGASISIRVRGGGSVSQSNEPLFIVDGFPVGSIADIPPSQIESIDVLKDASSTAIYGARGANGVIMVTTKNGKIGKLTIRYDNYLQFNEPTKYLETMNAYNYIDYNWRYAKAISDGYANAWGMLWGIGAYSATYNNPDGIDHYKSVNALNYSKQAYTGSFSHNHNVSISNGTNKTKYILSMSYTDDDGMKINSWFKRANAAFKLDQKISDKLGITFDTRFTDIQRMGNEGTTNGKGSVLSSAYQFRPIVTADVKGELNDSKNTQLGLYDYVLQDQYNPISVMSDNLPLSKERSLRSNVALDWTIIKGLTYRSELGVTQYWNKNKTWSGAIANNYIDASGNKTFAGNAGISSAEGWGLRWANILNYKTRLFNDNHQLNATLGQEVSNSASEGYSISGSRYPVSFSPERAFAMMDQYLHTTTVYYSLGSSAGTPGRMLSYFGRVNYSLLDKYLFTATFRADGSTRFAPKKKYGYFPAAAVAWRMSDENFLKDVKWLDNLKLRASYGEVGNDGINPGQWKPVWNSDGLRQYSINETQQSSYSPPSIMPNPELIWETTITRNVGFDFSVFDARLNGTVEMYKNSTRDLLLFTSIDASLGYTGMYQNIGSTSNRGIELSLNGDIIRKNDFNLSANFNINFNRGSVDELAPGVSGLYKTQWGSTMTQPNTGDYILQLGKPVGQVRGYTYDGWYSVDDFNYAGGIYTLKSGVADIASGIIGTVYGTTANKPGSQTAYPGVIKFKDLNKDGVINENDVSIIGDMNPKHTGGFGLSGNYKGFDFSLNCNWSYGNKIYNANYLAAFYGSKEDGLYKNRFNYLSTSYRIHDIVNGQLVTVTDPAALKALNANATTFLAYHENPVVSTLGVQNGSYLRLNTVTIGYNLPTGSLNRAHIAKLRVFGSIYNALTLTNYPGLDPEVNANTTQGNASYPTTGLDWGAYPRARSFTFGVNVEF